MTIYIDDDYKCYVSAADGRRAIETNYFDGKCTEWIEFTDMTAPWKDMANAYAAQAAYLAGKLAAAETDIAELDMALLDAEYENITGGTDDE